jgi:hypothetical protein
MQIIYELDLRGLKGVTAIQELFLLSLWNQEPKDPVNGHIVSPDTQPLEVNAVEVDSGYTKSRAGHNPVRGPPC